MTEVGDLLRLSIAKHAAAKGTPKRPPDARRKWSEAYWLRHKAHGLDPHHDDPAWQEEQGRTPAGRDTHTELMAFYRAMGIERIEPVPEPPPVCEPPPRREPEPPVVPEPQRSIAGTYETFATPEPREPEPPAEDHAGFELRGQLTPIRKRKPRVAKTKAKK